MNRAAHQQTLALLEVYGANQSRWPADVARQLAVLVAEDKSGVVTLALHEAEALDRVLARASTVSVGRQSALADRIMMAVQEEAGHQFAPVAGPVASTPEAISNVIALPTGGNRVAATHGAQRYSGVDWRAVAALAAALVLGIGVGVSGTASPTFQAVAETVGVNLDRSVLAFNDDHGGTMAALDDEDVL
jgi:hypothetical protein